jgi:hypothetical protein
MQSEVGGGIDQQAVGDLVLLVAFLLVAPLVTRLDPQPVP